MSTLRLTNAVQRHAYTTRSTTFHCSRDRSVPQRATKQLDFLLTCSARPHHSSDHAPPVEIRYLPQSLPFLNVISRYRQRRTALNVCISGSFLPQPLSLSSQTNYCIPIPPSHFEV